MQQISRARVALVTMGVASLLLATTVAAGASSSGMKGTYNANAAKLVPASFKGMTLKVASDASYAPDELIKNGNVIGFDVDLINAIATTLGIKVKTSNVTFNGILLGIQSGKYQIGNSSFTDNKKREKQVNFVDYFQAGEGVYARSSSMLTFTGLKGFCGHSVAVESGTIEQTDAENVSKTCASGKKVSVLKYSTQTEANLAVSSGHADFGFLDSQIAGYVVSQLHGTFKLVGSAVNVAPYGMATAKTPAGKGLAHAMQAALKVLIANGTYGAILTHWGVQAGALPAAKIILNGAIS